MKKIALSILATASILTSSATAGIVIDVQAGAGVWQPELTGNMGYGEDALSVNLELDSELDIKDTSSDFDNNYYYIDVDHFLPIVPNVRVERLNYSTTGSGKLLTRVNFGSGSFNASDKVDTQIDMVQNDFILYWGIPGLNTLSAGILDLDFGIMAKQLDGYYSVYETGDSSNGDKVDFDVWIPMGYLAVQVDVPFLPLELEVATKMISYEDSEISDNMAKASLALPIPLPLIDFKLDVGYRDQTLRIDPELIGSFNSDINAKGLFFGLSAKF